MLYGIQSRVGGVAQASRGPWFKDWWVEDDGLEWFYTFLDNDGNKCWLLSNNLSLQDRERFAHLYHTNTRNNRISWTLGTWLGFETVCRVPYFRSMALGWRFCSCLGLAFTYKSLMMSYSAQYYNPVVGAFLRKYDHCIKRDVTDITDEKREYFYIDTSQYMKYTNQDLGDEYHVHHGPQPEGESLDSSWLVEVDKFLNNEPNHLKEHKRFYNYNFEFIDKSFPSAEKVAEVMHRKD